VAQAWQSVPAKRLQREFRLGIYIFRGAMKVAGNIITFSEDVLS
jgi:hypothetical protein